MKLIIQIPCYNETDNLVDVLNDLPREISGVDTIETLIIDDGSTDGTSELALQLGVNHVVRNRANKGLARSFYRGIEECLKQDADIIVNTDGDNQYAGQDIAKLVQPIVAGQADIVVGDRGGLSNSHFSYFKRCLQVFGSAVIRKMTGLDITDAVSGFRAISRDAAQQLNIVSDFSYTIEMLIQASVNRLAVTSVPIRTNAKTRDSRLFKSVPQFLRMSVLTLVRMYTMYRSLRVFTALGAIAIFIGLIPVARFIYFYMLGDSGGHVQSLVLGGTLITLGTITLLFGIIADLISFNRKLVEKALHRIVKMESHLHSFDEAKGVSPEHELDRERLEKELKEMTKFMSGSG